MMLTLAPKLVLATALTTLITLTSLAALAAATGTNAQECWVATWSTALHPPVLGGPFPSHAGFHNQTLRQIVHTSVGGRQVRIRLAAAGATSLTVGAAHVALRADGARIAAESDRTLTFGGQPSITIPPGAVVVSDPVDLNVPALTDLAVTMFVPGASGGPSWHFVALQTSYVSPSGDFTDTVDMPVQSTTRAWFWLAGVDVLTTKQTGAIAALGDSVTDGNKSTPDANRRWPDQLARRLVTQAGNQKMGVLNVGLSGNRLLHEIAGPNGLARFDRDVLTQPGISYVIVFLGNNDLIIGRVIPEPVTVDQVIQSYRVLIARAHARGLLIYGATLTPLEGAIPPADFAIVEPQRQAINEWIRTSGEFDAVIDFDAVVRDPGRPSRLLAFYSSGDSLHPNDAGYEAMGDAVDLALFKK